MCNLVIRKVGRLFHDILPPMNGAYINRLVKSWGWDNSKNLQFRRDPTGRIQDMWVEAAALVFTSQLLSNL